MKANFDKGTKVCSGCGEELTLSQFQKNNYQVDGFAYNCKLCKSTQDKVYRQNNTQKFKEVDPYDRGQGDIKQCTNCQEDLPLTSFYRKSSNTDGLDIYCIQCKGDMDRQFYQKHKAQILQELKTPQGRQKHREYVQTRFKEEPLFRLSVLLRNRLRQVLNQQSLHKTSKLSGYLGCTLPELKAHLEKQFKPGMTWENQGEWHIDHIEPLSPKTPITEEEMYKRCHFTNLQPLWATDNIKKSNHLC